MRVVVGVGNRLREDDSIGLKVVEELMKETKNNDLKFFLGETVPENLIDKIKTLKPREVLIVDAVDFKGKPGDVMVSNKVYRGGFSHKMSYSLFSDLLNCDVKIIGIQPKNVGYGEDLSEEIKDTFDKVKDRVKKFL